MEIEITILNWEKYNPQNFQTRYPHWFRLNKEITRSQTLLDLTAEEKWVWVTLLCVACQRSSAKFQTTLKWLSREADVSIQSIENTLKKLVTANGLAINWQLTGREIGNQLAPTEQNITIQNNIRSKDRKSEKNPSGPPAKRASTKENAGYSNLISAYCAAYKTKYNARPPIDGRTQGLVKRIVNDFGVETACLLVQTYLQMDDPWFKTKAHDFVTFYENLTKISASMQAGKTVGLAPDQYRPIWELLREDEHDDRKGIRSTDTAPDDPMAKLLRE